MAMPSDLITIKTLKAWNGLTAATDDETLGMLISQISRSVISYINRSTVLPRAYTEVLDGNGKGGLMLKNWPVQSITSLTIDGQAIPAAKLFSDSGYLLGQADPEPPGSRQVLLLRHRCFHRGLQNVTVTYQAGYQIRAEPVVAAAAVTVQQPFGAWGSDTGVVNAATGAALAKVAGAPTQGQYQLSTTVVGGYVFNAADAGLNVLISYGFIPADLAEATLEWASERLAYRQRIGQQSKTLGGQETVSFAITDMPKFVTARLQQFCGVATL